MTYGIKHTTALFLASLLATSTNLALAEAGDQPQRPKQPLLLFEPVDGKQGMQLRFHYHQPVTNPETMVQAPILLEGFNQIAGVDGEENAGEETAGDEVVTEDPVGGTPADRSSEETPASENAQDATDPEDGGAIEPPPDSPATTPEEPEPANADAAERPEPVGAGD